MFTRGFGSGLLCGRRRAAASAGKCSCTANSSISGAPPSGMPMAASPGAMRSAAKRSKCSRDSQTSITCQPPSTGPETWKTSPPGGLPSGSISALSRSTCSAPMPLILWRIPTAMTAPSRLVCADFMPPPAGPSSAACVHWRDMAISTNQFRSVATTTVLSALVPESPPAGPTPWVIVGSTRRQGVMIAHCGPGARPIRRSSVTSVVPRSSASAT
jgi:hypothetical protein